MKRYTIVHCLTHMCRGGAETFIMNVLRNIDLEKYDESWGAADNVAKLINAIVDGTIHLIKNKTPENVLRELLGDW